MRLSQRTLDMILGGARFGARLRGGRRLMHPAGRSFIGYLDVAGGTRTGVPLLDEPATHGVTVRLSKGIPTPPGWPDVLGLAIRLEDRAGRPIDLLLSTSTLTPVLRQVFLPRRRIAGPYTSIAGFATPRGRRYLAAWAAPETDLGTRLDDVVTAMWLGHARFALGIAGRRGRWHQWGTLRLTEVLSSRTDAALAFDPARNVLPELCMTGMMRQIRAAAYRGSQLGRRAVPAGSPPANVSGVTGNGYSAQ